MLSFIFIRQYVINKLPRRFDVYYDPHTQTIHVLDSVQKLTWVAETVRNDVCKFSDALRRLHLSKK